MGTVPFSRRSFAVAALLPFAAGCVESLQILAPELPEDVGWVAVILHGESGSRSSGFVKRYEARFEIVFDGVEPSSGLLVGYDEATFAGLSPPAEDVLRAEPVELSSEGDALPIPTWAGVLEAQGERLRFVPGTAPGVTVNWYAPEPEEDCVPLRLVASESVESCRYHMMLSLSESEVLIGTVDQRYFIASVDDGPPTSLSVEEITSPIGGTRLDIRDCIDLATNELPGPVLSGQLSADGQSVWLGGAGGLWIVPIAEILASRGQPVQDGPLDPPSIATDPQDMVVAFGGFLENSSRLDLLAHGTDTGIDHWTRSALGLERKRVFDGDGAIGHGMISTGSTAVALSFPNSELVFRYERGAVHLDVPKPGAGHRSLAWREDAGLFLGGFSTLFLLPPGAAWRDLEFPYDHFVHAMIPFDSGVLLGLTDGALGKWTSNGFCVGGAGTPTVGRVGAFAWVGDRILVLNTTIEADFFTGIKLLERR